MARWRGLWHLPSLCVGGVRGRRARRPSEQQANSPRSQQSQLSACCQSARTASRRSRRRVGRATRAIFRPASPSHWDLAKLPLGGADAPSGSPSGSFARSQWDLRKSQWEKIKSHWEGETGRVGVAKRASKSEWERRGGPRRVPLGPPTGRRATTVRAPLPLGYLPSLLRINQRHHGLRTRLWHTPPAAVKNRRRKAPASEIWG